MCQPRPGPRCASHLKEQLAVLSDSLTDATLDEAQLKQVKEQYASIQFQYLGTKSGQNDLNRKAEALQAEGKISEAETATRVAKRALISHQAQEESLATAKYNNPQQYGLQVDPEFVSSFNSLNQQAQRRKISNRLTPTEMEYLSYSPDTTVKVSLAAVAEDNRILSRLMRRSAQDQLVLSQIANNRATSATNLGTLAESENELVRYDVAHNPRTSQQTAKKLSRDTSSTVRACIAPHPHLSQTDLEHLTQDPDVVVREFASSNPNMTGEMLSKLNKDNKGNKRIAFAISQHKNASGYLLSTIARDHSEDWHIQGNLAGNPVNHEDNLQELYASKKELLSVRKGLARNPRTPQLILTDLAKNLSADREISFDLSRNPHAPYEVLNAVAKVPQLSNDIALNLANHPNISKGALSHIAMTHSKETSGLTAQSRLERSS